MTNDEVDNGTVGVMDSNMQDDIDSLEEKVIILAKHQFLYTCSSSVTLTEFILSFESKRNFTEIFKIF